MRQVVLLEPHDIMTLRSGKPLELLVNGSTIDLAFAMTKRGRGPNKPKPLACQCGYQASSVRALNGHMNAKNKVEPGKHTRVKPNAK